MRLLSPLLMLRLPAFLLLAFVASPALAQAPPPLLPPLPGADGASESVAEAMQAVDMEMNVQEAMDAINAVARELAAAPEGTAPEAGLPAGTEAPIVRTNDGLDFYRRRTQTAHQTYPVVGARYGEAGDGFPSRTVVSGTIVDAGSLRLCRPGRAPVSRWLKIRLDGTPTGYAPAYFVVAVECHEDKKELLIGRRVRMDAWKSSYDQPIRMAADDVPAVDAPLFVSYAGNVILN